MCFCVLIGITDSHLSLMLFGIWGNGLSFGPDVFFTSCSSLCHFVSAHQLIVCLQKPKPKPKLTSSYLVFDLHDSIQFPLPLTTPPPCLPLILLILLDQNKTITTFLSQNCSKFFLNWGTLESWPTTAPKIRLEKA